jgi:hypothetical protein
MNSSRFDDLTKALATSTSRRQALKAIVATIIGGLLGLDSIGTASAKCHGAGHPCDENSTCCSHLCCNGVCCDSGQICQNGACVSPTTTSSSTTPVPTTTSSPTTPVPTTTSSPMPTAPPLLFHRFDV